jgi:hypothetical protein
MYRKAMGLNSLYSYPYLNCVLSIVAYTLSSTKLEIRAKWFLPGSRMVGEEWRGGGKGGEMTQTLYTPMNKRKINKYKN